MKSRTEGIDAALKVSVDDGVAELDALLIFDRKGAGQQMAAQAGNASCTGPTQRTKLHRISYHHHSSWS